MLFHQTTVSNKFQVHLLVISITYHSEIAAFKPKTPPPITATRLLIRLQCVYYRFTVYSNPGLKFKCFQDDYASLQNHNYDENTLATFKFERI